MSNHSSRKHRLKVPFLKFALTAAWEIITIKKKYLSLIVISTEGTSAGSSTGTQISGSSSNMMLSVTLWMGYTHPVRGTPTQLGDKTQAEGPLLETTAFRGYHGNSDTISKRETARLCGICVFPRSSKSFSFLAAVHKLIPPTASSLRNRLPPLGERRLDLRYMFLQHPVKWWWDLQGFLKYG